MHIPGDEDKRAIFSEMGKVRKRTKTQKDIKNGEIFTIFEKEALLNAIIACMKTVKNALHYIN